jgi:gamma-glutamyl phosphate reductase
VTLHAEANALALLKDGPANVVPVKAEQYDDEFLSLDLNVKIVATERFAVELLKFSRLRFLKFPMLEKSGYQNQLLNF